MAILASTGVPHGAAVLALLALLESQIFLSCVMRQVRQALSVSHVRVRGDRPILHHLSPDGFVGAFCTAAKVLFNRVDAREAVPPTSFMLAIRRVGIQLALLQSRR